MSGSIYATGPGAAGAALEADREVANTLAALIIGGTFSSDLPARPGPDGEEQGDEDPAA